MKPRNYLFILFTIKITWRREGPLGFYRKWKAINQNFLLDGYKYRDVLDHNFIIKTNNILIKYRNFTRPIKVNKIIKGFFKILLHFSIFPIYNKYNNNLHMHIDKNASFFQSIFSNQIKIRGWVYNPNYFNQIKLRLKVNGEIIQPQIETRHDLLQILNIKETSKNFGFNIDFYLKNKFNLIFLEGLINGKWKLLYFKILINLIKKLEKRKIEYSLIKNKRREFVKEQKNSIERHLLIMEDFINFNIIITNIECKDDLIRTLTSLNSQIYKKFTIFVECKYKDLISKSIINKYKINIISDSNLISLVDFIVALPSGCTLESEALYEFYNVWLKQKSVNIIYADQDYLVNGLICNPFYKPDWSPDYLETFNYIGPISCYKIGVINSKLLLDNSYDFILRYTEFTTEIFHIKKILGTSILPPSMISNDENSKNIIALNGRLKRTGRSGFARQNDEYYGSYWNDITLNASPLVSIVIPTAGKISYLNGMEKDLIVNIIQQIHQFTNYKNYEVILVDGGELSSLQIKKLGKYSYERIQHTNLEFNYSNSCNIGAKISRGDILVFLNDDIEILNPDWLSQIISHFEKPHVGIVGCKLLYPSGNLQHVGVVHNKGCPDHVMDGFNNDTSGYFFSVSGVRNFQAITGACQAIKRKIFFDVGGYSEDLAVCFNDTDLCMKVSKLSKYIVYDGKIELTHMTSQSRNAEAPININELNIYQQKWAIETTEDKFYNEKNLSILRPTFEPAINLDTV
jgi:GT2 family glycosyltransferase